MSEAVEANRREDLRHQLRFYFTLVLKDAKQKDAAHDSINFGWCAGCHGKTARGNNLCSTCLEFVVDRFTERTTP
jgi:cytochrome c553